MSSRLYCFLYTVMYASMGSFMAAKTVHVDSLTTSPNKFLFKRQMTFIQYLRLCKIAVCSLGS